MENFAEEVENEIGQVQPDGSAIAWICHSRFSSLNDKIHGTQLLYVILEITAIERKWEREA